MAKPRNVQISQERRFFQFREDGLNAKTPFSCETACSFLIALPIHIAGILRVPDLRKVPNIRLGEFGFQWTEEINGVIWGVWVPLGF